MATEYAISDTHFSHEFMINRGIRPFASTEEMDEFIVEQWNKTVKPYDKVNHLGDVAMKRSSVALMKRCNGKHRLIGGNHDIYDLDVYLDAGFQKVFGARELHGMLLTHVPVHPICVARFVANVHGHIHQTDIIDDPRYVNVCVEVVDYTPIALEVIRARFPEAK